MSDYKVRFDAHLAAATSAALNRTTALRDGHFGMHPNHVRRTLENISKLLGRVDAGSADNPEYLALQSSDVPERSIDLISQIPNSLNDGIDTFTKGVLPQLLQMQDALEKAIGIGSYKIGEIKTTQIRKLAQIIDFANQRHNEATASKKKIEDMAAEAAAVRQTLDELLNQAVSDGEKVSSTRALAEKLAGGGATRNPLEGLLRQARDKSSEIESALTQSKASAESAVEASSDAQRAAEKAKVSAAGLEQTEEKARGILNNATQAGLAGAYKVERDKLESQQQQFAFIFYGIIASIVAYAALFILPILREILDKDTPEIFTEDNAILLLARTLVLIPAIWGLIFTNRRYETLETLQMDYAAKATTALAYSGYRDEMEDDVSLSVRLKDGLVARFLEHPSRLLGNKVESSKSRVSPRGVEVVSETHSKGSGGLSSKEDE